MQPCNRIYYSKIYWRLNMFRAAHRSSSGALNCICSRWFINPCGVRPLSRLSGKKHISVDLSRIWLAAGYFLVLPRPQSIILPMNTCSYPPLSRIEVYEKVERFFRLPSVPALAWYGVTFTINTCNWQEVCADRLVKRLTYVNM